MPGEVRECADVQTQNRAGSSRSHTACVKLKIFGCHPRGLSAHLRPARQTHGFLTGGKVWDTKGRWQMYEILTP